MKRMVADTGPLLHLREAGALDLLPLIGSIHVPTAVVRELRSWNLLQTEMPRWFQIENLMGDAVVRAHLWQQGNLLHVGEAEALSLAVEFKPEWFLTDDAAARLMANSLGLESRGSLGVILWAAANKLIDRKSAESFLDGLENSSLWLSPRVRIEARSALAKLFLV